MQGEIAVKDYMNQFFYILLEVLGFLSIIFAPKFVIIFQILLLFIQILSFNLLYSIHKKVLYKIKMIQNGFLISFVAGLVAHLLFIISD